MRKMQPRIGFGLVCAVLLAMGMTSAALAAPSRPAQSTCYSTCPLIVDLEVSSHVLRVGSEEFESFFVSVELGNVGEGPAPTGTVTIKAGSTVLCTMILVGGRGSCSPGAVALPSGHYQVVAYYSGDNNYGPSQSRPEQLQIIRHNSRCFGGPAVSDFLINLFGVNDETFFTQFICP